MIIEYKRVQLGVAFDSPPKPDLYMPATAELDELGKAGWVLSGWRGIPHTRKVECLFWRKTPAE